MPARDAARQHPPQERRGLANAAMLETRSIHFIDRNGARRPAFPWLQMQRDLLTALGGKLGHPKPRLGAQLVVDLL